MQTTLRTRGSRARVLSAILHCAPFSFVALIGYPINCFKSPKSTVLGALLPLQGWLQQCDSTIIVTVLLAVASARTAVASMRVLMFSSI